MASEPKQLRSHHLSGLMCAAQDGDRASYQLLLQESIPIIRGFIFSRTRLLSRQDIEDVIQDVLLSVHQARRTYDPARPFIPWLLTIARYRLTDHGRRASRRWKNEVEVEKLPETFSDAAANMPMETYGDVEALRIAIAELPEGQRRALGLTKIRGLSLSEASAETGMSITALKVSVHRAVKTLRARLSKDN